MGTEILLYTLRGCDVCDKLKNYLSQSNILYTEKICNGENKDCDKIENLIGCEYYPIVHIKTKNNNNTILCLADTYADVEKTRRVNATDIVIYKQSINSLFDYIQLFKKY